MITRYTVSGPGTLTEAPEGEYVRWDDDLQAAMQMAAFTAIMQDKLGKTGGFVWFEADGDARFFVGNPALDRARDLLCSVLGHLPDGELRDSVRTYLLEE